MIANINPRGHSFNGVSAYLLHDKGAETDERVLWTATRNLHTDDVEKATRFMAWTDGSRDALRATSGGNSAGRKSERGNVYHYSLSWSPGSEVDRAEMERAADETVKRLRLAGHQYYLVAHSDTGHAHVHVVANLVHPETGKIASNYRDQKTLDRWAYEYEKQHGIECLNRARKYEAWDQEKKAFRDKDRRAERGQVITEAFHRSDSGQAFAAALKDEDLQLARGARRGFVVVDRDGEIFALNRLIELPDGTKGRAKSAAITKRLKDIDPASLEQADAVAEQRKTWSREAAEVSGQKKLAEAADKAAEGRVQKERQEAARKQEQQRKAELYERQVKWRALQREVDDKTALSREKWQIDELTKTRDEARAKLEGLGGFWSRVFKRREIAETKDHLQDYEKRLAERTGRFRDDVAAFNKARPDWIQKRELKRHGLEPGQVAKPSASQAWKEPQSELSEKEAKMRKILDQLRQRREQERGPDRGPDHDLGR